MANLIVVVILAAMLKSKSISLSVWNFSSHLQLVKVAGDFFIRSWYSKW